MNKIELLENMLSADPDNSKFLYLLAVEYKACGQFQKAEDLFQKALVNADLELSKEILSQMSEAVKIVNVPKNINESDNDEDEKKDNDNDKSGNNLKLRVIKNESKIIHLNAVREPNPPSASFKDVGGLEDVKKSINTKIVKPFLNPELFIQFRKKSGGGILMFGPPGCGKTFIARATAGECKAHFKPVYITDILSSYFGQSAQNMHDIFETARAKRPCILFFDEIDALGFKRSKTSTDMMRSVVNQLLTEIDGIESDTQQLLVMGATNAPWDIDPALLRPGRFDKSIFVPPPDGKAREAIFKIKLHNRPIGKIDYSRLASITNLFSGADIENVVELAAENVLEKIVETGNNALIIENNDLENAIMVSKPSTTEWLKVVANYTKYSNQSGFYDDVDLFLKENKRYL